jgi:hypothetical protein
MTHEIFCLTIIDCSYNNYDNVYPGVRVINN